MRLLTVGNSFAANATRYLEEMAEAAGKRVTLGRANIGGASLERHWRSVQAFEADASAPAGKPYLHDGAKRSLREILQAEPWDVVTIQQFSWLSHDADTFRPYARLLHDYIRRYCPMAEVRIHQTWAYREDELRSDYTDQAVHHADIRRAYHAIAGELGVRIIPVGEAFAAVRNHAAWQRDFTKKGFDPEMARYPELPDQSRSLCRGWTWRPAENGEWELRLDTHHANATGCYLGAAVFYECLFGKDVTDNTYAPPELDPQDALFLRSMAHRTVADQQNVMPTSLSESCAVATTRNSPETGLRLARIFTDHAVIQQNLPVPVWGWAQPQARVSVRFAGQRRTARAAENGRWIVWLDEVEARVEGQELSVETATERATIRDVVVGEVWMCGGQSNMNRTMATDLQKGYTARKRQIAGAEYPLIRYYKPELYTSYEPLEDIDHRTSGTVSWQVVSPETVRGCSSLPYFFARELHRQIDVPIGLVQHCVSGTGSLTWMPEHVLKTRFPEQWQSGWERSLREMQRGLGCESHGEWQTVTNKWQAQWDRAGPGSKPKWPGLEDRMAAYNQPCVLDNALVHPLAPYAVRGMIWHRGEAGPGDITHAAKFKAMVDHWRGLWQSDFYVIWGSLSNIRQPAGSAPEPHTYRLINEQYLMNLEDISSSGMVNLLDLGNWGRDDIPPEVKQTNGVHYEAKDVAGHRYALCALKLVYDPQRRNHLSPCYERIEREGRAVRVYFRHLDDGLVMRPGRGPNRGFVIEDKAGNRYWGEAKLDGNAVLVWSDEVEYPAVVYYGFHINPVLTLYNTRGLPVLSFRTANVGTRVASGVSD